MTSKQVRAWLVCVALCAACVVTSARDAHCEAAAHRHPVLIARGTLALSGSRLEFTLEPSAHDLRHEGLDPADPASWSTSAKSLATSIAVLDERGARLPVTLVEATESVTRLAANVGERARYVTMQLRPSDDSGALAMNRQVHLEWSPGARPDTKDAPASRSLRLTTGGNSETIDLRPEAVDGSRTPDLAVMGDARFSRAILMPGEERREGGPPVRVIRCSVPLSLLQTWPAMAEPSTDALGTEDVKLLESHGAAWLAEAVTVCGGSGEIPVRLREVRVVGPGESAFDPPGKVQSSLCRWSARLTATIVPVDSAEDQPLQVFWTAFNSALGTVDVIVGGRKEEVRASRCGIEMPARASSVPWRLLPEGFGPSGPGR